MELKFISLAVAKKYSKKSRLKLRGSKMGVSYRELDVFPASIEYDLNSAYMYIHYTIDFPWTLLINRVYYKSEISFQKRRESFTFS